MQRITIPGEVRKGTVRRDDMHLHSEVLKINKDIRKLERRREQLQALFTKARFQYKSDKAEAYYEQPIYLYVLKLSGGKYYVGMTRNVERRFAKHSSGKGANWTKLYKPIAIIKRVNTQLTNANEVAILENQLTFETVLEYGMDHVRGGGYCQMHPRWPQSLYDDIRDLRI